MRYPDFLKPNGTIGYVAPSFGCTTEPYKTAFEYALKLWRDKEYYVNLGPNVYEAKGIGISNTPEACGKELTEYYVNQNTDILLACGGGEMMCEILPYVDFEAIGKAKPKWYMGYSDNTNFTFMLTTLCDVASLYGPNGPTFGMEPWHPSLEDVYDILTGNQKSNETASSSGTTKLSVHNYDKYEIESLKSEENPLAPYNCTEDVWVKAFAPNLDNTDGTINNKCIEIDNEQIITNDVMSTNTISFNGRIIGGCLDCLVNLLGTRFDYVNQFVEKYKEDGIVWYLEACDLNVFAIRRAMWQMQEAGWFKYVKGFIIGRPANGETMFGLNRFDAVLPYTCVQNKVPVIMDADIGHRPPQMIMINGALGSVSFQNGALRIDYSLE